MSTWIVTRVTQNEIEAETAVEAIEAAKKSKSRLLVDVSASAAQKDRLSIRTATGVHDDCCDCCDCCDDEEDEDSSFVRDQIAHFSDGRLKNEWFKTLRNMAGGDNCDGIIEYRDMLHDELDARGFLDANGYVISMSGTRTSRRW